MTPPISTEGVWWLPEFPENKIQGHLSFTINEGISLSLAGPFPAPKSGPPFGAYEPHKPEVILGTVKSGAQCTLAKNFSEQLGAEPRYVSDYLFVGDHLSAKLSECRFSAVSFRLRHLEEWTGLTPLEPDDGRSPFSPKFENSIPIAHCPFSRARSRTPAPEPSVPLRALAPNSVCRLLRPDTAPP
jgi:hypothetical protein